MNEKLMRLGASPLTYLDHTVLNDESTSASFILIIPLLEKKKHKFLSEKPLRTPGKFCLNFALYVLFAFTSLLIDREEKNPKNTSPCLKKFGTYFRFSNSK